MTPAQAIRARVPLSPLRVLVACEFSGVVRDAFRALGHDAWSCDLLPAADGSPFHYQCDVEDLLIGERLVGVGVRHGVWDMLIAHPPCDYLANCAAWAFGDPDFTRYPGVGYHQKVKASTLTGAARRVARDEATAFFLALWQSRIPRICIENPIGAMNTHPALPDSLPGRQIIQPHQFGEDASKATCLWLKGLPPLRPTGHVKPRRVCKCGAVYTSAEIHCPGCGASPSHSKPRWANQTDSGQNRLSPSDDRASVRAVTYGGIAEAMADQWGSAKPAELAQPEPTLL